MVAVYIQSVINMGFINIIIVKLRVCKVICKGKGHPRTGHEGPEGEKKNMYIIAATHVQHTVL